MKNILFSSKKEEIIILQNIYFPKVFSSSREISLLLQLFLQKKKK